MIDVVQACNVGSDDLYVSRDDNAKRILILSALDELVIGQEGLGNSDTRPYLPLSATDHDYEIHADTLTIRGTIRLPGRNITLFARYLRGEKSVDSSWPEIRVDGPSNWTVPDGYLSMAANGGDGADCPRLPDQQFVGDPMPPRHNPDWDAKPGAPGDRGAEGKQGGGGGNAGNIFITYGSYQLSSLMLWALGGAASAGGAGQHGGRGGNGGNGGFNPHAYIMRRFYGPCQAMPGAPAGGGDGGRGGKGGTGGNGGQVGVTSVYVPVDGGTIGLRTYHGGGGDGGPGGPAGQGGIWGLLQDEHGASRQAGSGPSGNQGSTGDRGDNGVEGSNWWRTIDDVKNLYPSANYSHCCMLLERARRDYMSGDPVNNPDALRAAKVKLSWLYDVTSRFSDRQKTWTDPDDVLGCCLFTAVFNLLRQLRGTGDDDSPLDVFGYRYDHVPFYPLNSYLADITQTLPWFKDLEASYRDYLKALSDQRQAEGKRQEIRDNVQGQRIARLTEIKKAWAAINDLEAAIVEATEVVADRRTAMLDDLAHIEIDLQKQTNCPKIDDVTSALQMLAFVPPVEKNEEGLAFSPAGGLMAGVEAFTLLTKDTATTKVMAGDGTLTDVPTTYLVNRLETLDGTLKSLQTTYTANKAGITESPDCIKALTSAQAIDDLLDKIQQSIPDAAAARKSTDAYIDAITHRSALVLQYNERLATMRKLSSEYQDLEMRNSKLGEKLSRSELDALSPEIVAWMSRAYEAMRTDIVQMCYWVGRAYSFALLKDPPTDLGTLLKDDPRGLNSSTLEALLTAYQRRHETDLTVPQIFPADPTDVLKGGKGRHVLLNADMLARFKQKQSCSFTLAPPQDAQFSAVASPFQSMSNVRIAAVCVWLEGVKLTSGQQISIVVTRDGATGDSFLASNGERRFFTHGPLKSSCTCTMEPDASKVDRITMVPATLSTPQFDYTQKTFDVANFAMPGPYGVWKIAIDQDACVDTSKPNQPQLDMDALLKDVTAIRIEFIGLAQAIQETTTG